jgi:hypothetical protein
MLVGSPLLPLLEWIVHAVVRQMPGFEPEQLNLQWVGSLRCGKAKGAGKLKVRAESNSREPLRYSTQV